MRGGPDHRGGTLAPRLQRVILCEEELSFSQCADRTCPALRSYSVELKQEEDEVEERRGEEGRGRRKQQDEEENTKLLLLSNIINIFASC